MRQPWKPQRAPKIPEMFVSQKNENACGSLVDLTELVVQVGFAQTAAVSMKVYVWICVLACIISIVRVYRAAAAGKFHGQNWLNNICS